MIRRPLFWSSFPFACGVLCVSDPSAARGWGAVSFVLLTGGLALAMASRSRAGGRAAGALVAAGWGACGGFAGAAAAHDAPQSLSRLLARHPEALSSGVTLRGEIQSPPEVHSGMGRDCRIGVAVRARAVTLGRIDHAVEGGVTLWVTGDCARASRQAASWKRGDRVRGFVRLAAPRGFRVPGGDDAPRRQRARGIHAIAQAKSLRLIDVQARDGPGPALHALRWVDRARAGILARMDEAFPQSRGGRRAAAVCRALLVGDRRGLDADSARRLQDAGLSHLLAVSGFNVALLAALVLAAAGAAGWRGRGAAALCLPVLAVYLLLNRDESSVARAVLMAAGLLGARTMGLRADARNALGLAAIVLLALSPLRAHDPGFQLTFAATLALIEADRGRAPGGGARGRGPAAALLRATLAALMVTTPLVAWHFNRINPGALPANLAAGPLMSVVFVMALGIEALAPLSAAAARLAALPAERMVDLVFSIAAWSTSHPALSYRRPDPHLMLVGLCLGSLAAAVWLSRRGHRVAARPAWAAWIGAMLVIAWPLDTRGGPAGLRVTAFDVGQGDAVLVEAPGGTRVLVDAGGAVGDFDAGERTVSRALWHLGIARLDVLVITHADMDHAGGAPAIARNFAPREIWVPRGWHGHPTEAGRRLARAVPAATWIREMAAGDAVCLAGARAEALHPPAGASGDPGDNERSLVLAFSAPRGGALMMGDAGARTEARLPGRMLPARLLKVGHHGSRGASSSGFLEEVGMRVALISCGQANRFGHPHPEAVARLERAGARVLTTSRHGTLEVELRSGGTRLDGLFRALPGRGARE